jgi:hypothetical protein
MGRRSKRLDQNRNRNVHNEGIHGWVREVRYCRARDMHVELLWEDPRETDCLEAAAFDEGGG